MKSMKDMKINFPVYILHALHVLHGKIKNSMLEFITLSWGGGIQPIDTERWI